MKIKYDFLDCRFGHPDPQGRSPRTRWRRKLWIQFWKWKWYHSPGTRYRKGRVRCCNATRWMVVSMIWYLDTVLLILFYPIRNGRMDINSYKCLSLQVFFPRWYSGILQFRCWRKGISSRVWPAANAASPARPRPRSDRKSSPTDAHAPTSAAASRRS